MRSRVVLKSNFTNLQVVKASSYVRLKPLSTSFTHRPTEISPSTFSKADASALQVHFLSSCAVQVFFFLSLFSFSFYEKPFIARIRFDVKRCYFFRPLGEIVLMPREKERKFGFSRELRNLRSFLQREHRNGNISYRLLPSSFLRNAFDQISISGNLVARYQISRLLLLRAY